MSRLTELEQKICAECGTTIDRAGENLRDWRARKYCARSCYFAFKARMAHVGPQPRSARRSKPEYLAWDAIIQRCENPKNANYHNYGGRGITVCEKWRVSFEAFFADLGPRPSPNHSVGRINNDGGYEPGNVRWETWAQQGSNRRTTRHLTAFGRTQTLSEWARELGAKPHTLLYRIDTAKWPIEIALGNGPKLGRRLKHHREQFNVPA